MNAFGTSNSQSVTNGGCIAEVLISGVIAKDTFAVVIWHPRPGK